MEPKDEPSAEDHSSRAAMKERTTCERLTRLVVDHDGKALHKRGDVGLRSWRSRFTLLHATHTISETMHGPAYSSHVVTQEALAAIH